MKTIFNEILLLEQFFLPPFVLYEFLTPNYSSIFVPRPGMNRCDISEETTTKALYALYQMPVPEGQHNVQSNATGTEIGVGSAGALQCGPSHQNSSSDVLSDRGKKKLGFKEKKTKFELKNAQESGKVLLFSDSTLKNAQESGKVKSDQHLADVNPMRKPGSQQFSKSNNSMEVKHLPELKEHKRNRGTAFISKLILMRQMHFILQKNHYY